MLSLVSLLPPVHTTGKHTRSLDGLLFVSCTCVLLYTRNTNGSITAFVWIYIINFAYSWGPGSWILIAEIFPISIRAKGTSIGASANWMNNFAIAFMVPPMLENITWGTYIFFAVWTFAGGAYIYFFVPETKGKTLEEMDQVFGSHTGVEEMEEFARVQERVGLTALLTGRPEMNRSEEEKDAGTVMVEDVRSI
jgi:Sugar (and other) transporter